MEASNRQKKIAGVLQGDLARVLQETLRKSGQLGIIITVSKVHVTVDLSLAKVYISVFPANRAAAVLGEIVKTGPRLKHEVAKRTKNQLRKMPDLSFYHDDTTAYIEGIENAMRGSENPITDPALLPKRKKS